MQPLRRNSARIEQTRSYWPYIRPQVNEFATNAQTQYSQKNVTKIAVHMVSGRLGAMGLTRIEAICTCLTHLVMFTGATTLSHN